MSNPFVPYPAVGTGTWNDATASADAFVKSGAVGTGSWSVLAYPASTFAPLSSTGLIQVAGGYGIGGYGEGGYGDNSSTIAIGIELNTTWTSFTTR